MKAEGSPELPEMAFRYAKNKENIREAVLALIEKLGIGQGSISATANSYAAYDFYALLRTYINNPEARLKIHKIIDEAK